MIKFQSLWLLSGLFFSFQLHAVETEKEVTPSYKTKSNKEAVKHYNVDQRDLAVLSPITVTTGPAISDELLSPKSVTIYTKEDLSRSGVTSLLDFFKNFTEIQTDPSFGNVLNPQLSMRGFGNGDGYQNINIIVDGVTLNQIDQVPQQLASVPVTSVEKIEVVKSSGSVVYGDNAAAGTIIIRTNNSSDRNPLYGAARTSFGTYDTSLTNVNLGSVTDYNGLKVMADGKFSYLDSNGKKPVMADGTKDTVENLNGKATLGFQKNGLEVTTSFIKDDANVNYTGFMKLDDFHKDPNASVTNGRENIVHKEDWSTLLKYKINDNFNLSYNYTNKTKDSKFPNNFTPFAPYLPHYEGEDHRLTLQTIQDDFVVLTGFEHNNNMRSDNSGMTSKENIAGFISGDYFVNDRLTLNAGVRQASITFDHGGNGTGASLTKSVNPTAYNAALNYTFSQADALSANYAHSFQSPDIDRFYNPLFDNNFKIIGAEFNKFINTMSMDTYSIGYKHLDDGLKIKAEFYYSDLNNEIYFNSNTFTNTNYDSSSKHGVDLSLYKDFGYFYGNVNYVYTSTRAKIGTQAYQIAVQPAHIVLATIGKEFTSTLLPLSYHHFSVSHKYQSESFADGDFDNSLGRQQPYNATTLSYQLSDHRHWTVDFSIQNLFDVTNGQFVDFGGSKPVVYPTNYQRTFQGSISYRF